MYEKISSYNWLFDVRYYECPSVIFFKTNVDDATEVLLAQDLGKTLTAPPVSIRHLRLLCLSATYNNLAGYDAIFATSRWPIIL